MSMIAMSIICVLGMLFASRLDWLVRLNALILVLGMLPFIVQGGLSYFIVRCPRCRVSLGWGTGIGLKRIRSSPGCSVPLDEAL